MGPGARPGMHHGVHLVRSAERVAEVDALAATLEADGDGRAVELAGPDPAGAPLVGDDRVIPLARIRECQFGRQRHTWTAAPSSSTVARIHGISVAGTVLPWAVTTSCCHASAGRESRSPESSVADALTRARR